jgi:hypothetical protein
MALTESKKINASITLPSNPREVQCHLRRKAIALETGTPTTPPFKTVGYAIFATGWLGRPSDTKCRPDCSNLAIKVVTQQRQFEENKAAMERHAAEMEAKRTPASENEGAEYLLKEANYREDLLLVEELS